MALRKNICSDICTGSDPGSTLWLKRKVCSDGDLHALNRADEAGFRVQLLVDPDRAVITG